MIQSRMAVEGDLERLFGLDQVCFPAGIAYSKREFRSLLASSRTIGLVAEENDSLAGFVLAQSVRARRGSGGHIVTIDVAPEFRRRGVGGRLMEQLETHMREARAEWLRLEVAVDNFAALKFYERLGFSAIGRIRGYYPGNLDALAMEKALKAPGKSGPADL